MPLPPRRPERRPAGAVLAVLLALQALPAAGEWVRIDDAVMGTTVRVELEHPDRVAGEAAARAALQELRRIDRLMSPYRPDSALSRLNREGEQGPVEIGTELARLIDRSLAFSVLTGGAFDVTFAAAGRLYDYRAGRRPRATALEAALPAIDYRDLEVDPRAGTARLGRPGMRVDLGGIAKGYAVDRCIDLLRARGVRDALVTAGGDTRVIGQRRGGAWTVGIRDPRDEHGLVAKIPLSDRAVSTSGDYQRYFVEDGVRYHHILDPRSGAPAAGLRSVTVIGPDAITTDALSTGVFVLGSEAGLALVEGLPEVEAVLVDQAGRMHYSSGLAEAGRSAPPTGAAVVPQAPGEGASGVGSSLSDGRPQAPR